MLTVSNVSLQFGKRVLFDEVNMKFTKGNCYGIIGANGAGKSTFLKILSNEIEPTAGKVSIEPGKRMSVLSQDHNAYDKEVVLNVVIQGNKKLYSIKQKLDSLYAKEDFSEQDGIEAADLGAKYEEMGGWMAESDAAQLLSSLGIQAEVHQYILEELDSQQKVRVLLAQALFGNPDILILDEPTNDLDVRTISWLEDFLGNYEHTIIVVSHDRHFLDAVCTNICDIDFSKINSFSGNYTFWYESSELAKRQQLQQNKKAEEKKKELQEFIQRFSSNVAKAKQATARKKMLEKLNVYDIKPSSRKYPAIIFESEREIGDQVLEIKKLEAKNEDGILFSNTYLNVNKGDKIAILSKSSLATTAFFQKIQQESQDILWGITTKHAYIPLDNSSFFQEDISLVEWMRQFVEEEEEQKEQYLRGFLGKMLFSGDEALKSAKVLSGGEKMRCMFSRMMLSKPNVLLFDEPTNHLDLESITALNNSLKNFKGTILITSRDHKLIQTVCNRIVELTPNGVIDRMMTYDEYLANDKIKEIQREYYS